MSDTALVVVDMLNHYRHEDAEKLAPNVAPIIDPLVGLIEAARRRDDVEPDLCQRQLRRLRRPVQRYRRCRAGRRAPGSGAPDRARGRLPAADQVRHSVFYATALHYLLGRLGSRRVVLAAARSPSSAFSTRALDAYVRHFDVVVPADAVAHIDAGLGNAALEMMRRNMSAKVVPASECLG